MAGNLFEQFSTLNVPLKISHVNEIVLDGDIKKVKTNNDEYKSKTVIIASGRKPRKLNAIGEKDLIGKGISYCHLCDGNLYKNKITAVIGGGNSAVSGALYLSNICKKVYLIVRKDYLKAEDVYQLELENKNNIEILYNTEVKKIVEKGGVVNKVILNNGDLAIDGLFVNIGYEPANDFYKKLGISNENGFIEVDKNMQTSVSGIFAAGDIIEKDVYQIITAQSEGAIAAISAYNYINYTKE